MPGPIAPIPSPRTWASGPILAPSLRADVSDAVAFLTYRPVAVLVNQQGTSWPSGVDTTLGCNTELYDNWNGHNGASPTQYFAQAPGWYLCQASVPFTYGGTTQFQFVAGFVATTGGVTGTGLRGGELLNGNGRAEAPRVCDLIEQTVTGPIGGTGDWIQPYAAQNTGSAVNLANTSSLYPYVTIRWVALNAGTVSLPVPANPSWVSPPSFVTSAFLNANIRDTINFLLYPPIARAHYAAGTATLASAAFPAASVVPLDTVDVDNYGGFTTGAAAKYTAPVTGSYFVYGQYNLHTSTATTGYCAGLSVNGGTTMWGDALYKMSDTFGGGATVTKRLRLTAGQSVQLMAGQASGAAIMYQNNSPAPTKMIVVWEGS